ncbi:AraC family transcriptional regulator [Saccharothrix sp. ALI-22-I]|uniref:AraC family transcriptional regulator n=1 Tax=Saccharothrix sp. ALI-22-I TaxID=1933778 RepID=UPI00097BFD15|nr:AraC family transcriptional regulator [Saccharothrix sp. ALI-22-I]ONI91105.1 AraC family transcriptional regulator [Saccharothrix sp. ALI-22-I]
MSAEPANTVARPTNRSTSATIPPIILRYLTALSDELGADLRPTLARVGLDETMLQSVELRVSYRQGSEVIRRAVQLTGDEHLGLRVGARQHPTAWGLMGFALMAADTLRDAVETGVRFQNLSGAMVVWSAGQGDAGFTLWADLPDPALDPAVGTFLVDEAFANVVTVTRLVLGPEFRPRLVEFTFPAPRDPGPFEDLFGCPVRFSAPRNAFVFPAAWARTAMPGRDPVTYASTLEVLDAQAASRRPRQDLLEVLEISIAQSLPTVPTFAEQARRHATGERTLRRRLAECGTTYEALVDGVRREQVEQLIRQPELTLTDITRRVGFSDVRALRRAIRRWHGVTPLQLREAVLDPEGPV